MSKKPILVCIGNSIVNGYPHKRSQCFASLLRESTDYDVINKGENGDTAVGMLYRFPQDVLSKNPDYMMLLTGTNDFISGLITPERCMEIVAQMCEMSWEKNISVILLTPIICDAERAAQEWVPADYNRAAEQLVEFSKLMKKYGEEHDNCMVLDLQEAYKECNQFVDGIHPTVEGQAFIADFIRPLLP